MLQPRQQYYDLPLYFFLPASASLLLTGSIWAAPHNRQALNTKKMLQLNFNISLRVCACQHLRFQLTD